jgi:hypothetical protein
MEFIVYIIVALIPSAALTTVVYLFLKKSKEREISMLTMQMKKERQKYFLEPRAEAYQRIILLLERINPQNLIMRVYSPNLKAADFQRNLLENIRKEFDHNAAQQLFVGVQSWELIKKSKEETIKIINIAGKQMTEEDDATALSNKIFEIVAEVGELPSEIAVKVLKEEFQKLF